MKSFIFLVGTTKGGVQYPHELIRYWPLIYVLCISSHFWPFAKANLVLEIFNKNLGFGQTPPPLVGPNAQLFPKKHFDGPPNSVSSIEKAKPKWKYPQKLKKIRIIQNNVFSAIELWIKVDKALTNPNEKAPKNPSENKIDPNRCCSVIVLCAYTDSNRPRTHQTAYNLHIHSFMMMKRAKGVHCL